jgi:hypothetical protein
MLCLLLSKINYFINRNDFKDYSLQSRLHFRIHSAQDDLKKLATCKKYDNGNSVPTTEECNEALDEIGLDKDCEFLDAEDGDLKEREYSESNLAFKTAITDEDARKIIAGKQLK